MKSRMKIALPTGAAMVAGLIASAPANAQVHVGVGIPGVHIGVGVGVPAPAYYYGPGYYDGYDGYDGPSCVSTRRVWDPNYGGYVIRHVRYAC